MEGGRARTPSKIEADEFAVNERTTYVHEGLRKDCWPSLCDVASLDPLFRISSSLASYVHTFREGAAFKQMSGVPERKTPAAGTRRADSALLSPSIVRVYSLGSRIFNRGISTLPP